MSKQSEMFLSGLTDAKTKEEKRREFREKQQVGALESVWGNVKGGVSGVAGTGLRSLGMVADGLGLDNVGNALDDFGQDLEDYAANQAELYGTRKKYDDMGWQAFIPGSGYYTDPRGLWSDIGQGAGSSALFLPIGGIGGKVVGGVAGKAAQLLGKRIPIPGGATTEAFLKYGIPTGVADSFINSGEIISELQRQGYTNDEIRAKMLEAMKETLPMDIVAAGTLGTWLTGKLPWKPKTWKGYLGKNATATGVDAALVEGPQEVIQFRATNRQMGREVGEGFDLTPEEIAAYRAGVFGTLGMGGAGTVVQTYSDSRAPVQKETQNPPEPDQTRGFNYNDFSDLNTTRPDPKRIYDFWRAYGMNQEAALGILASMDMESWGFQDSGITNEIGAFGLFQFYQGRKEDYLNWCQRNGIEHPEYALPQLQYVVEVDMKNQIGNARNPYNAYRVPLQSLNDFEPESLNQFKDPYQVAYHWEFGFERPGEDTDPGELDQRVDYWRQQLEGRDSGETQRSTIPSDHLETKYYQKWSRALDLDTPWDNQEYTDTVNFKPAMFEFLNDLGARMEAIGVTPIITGGADKYGHAEGTYSHANGYKVDIDDTRIPEGSEAHRILMQVAEEYGAEVVHEAENGHYDIVIRRDEPLRRAQTSPRYSGQPNREADGDNQSSEIEIPRPLFDINALMEEENIESGLTEQIMRDYLQSVKETGNEEQKELANRMLDSEGDFRMSRANVQEVSQREGENIVDFVTANEGRYLVPDEVRNMLGMVQKLRKENAEYAGDMETARDATEKMNYWFNRGRKNRKSQTKPNPDEEPIKNNTQNQMQGMSQREKDNRMAELLMKKLTATMENNTEAIKEIDAQIAQLRDTPITDKGAKKYTGNPIKRPTKPQRDEFADITNYLNHWSSQIRPKMNNPEIANLVNNALNGIEKLDTLNLSPDQVKSGILDMIDEVNRRIADIESRTKPQEENQSKARRTPPEILDAVKLTGKKPRDAGTLHVEMLDDNKVKLRGEMKQTKGNPIAFNGLKDIAKEIGGTYNSRSKTFNFQNPEDAELFSQTAQIYLDNGMESLDREPTRPWDNVGNNKDEVPQEIPQGSRQETKEYPDKEIDYKQPNPLQTPEQNQTAEQPIQKPAKIDQPAPDTTPQPRVNENKIAPMEDNPLTRNNPILQSDKQHPDKDAGEVDASRLTQKLAEKNNDDQNQNGISDEAERIFNEWWNRREPDRKNPKIAQIMDDTQDRVLEKLTQTRNFDKQIEIVKSEIRRVENIISKIRPWDKHLKESKMNEKDEGIARNESKDIPNKEVEKGNLSDYKQAEEKTQDKEAVGNPTEWLNQAHDEQEEEKRPRARKIQGTHTRKHRPIQEVDDFGDDIHEEDEEEEVRDVYPADEVDDDDELIDEPSKYKTSPTEEDIVQKYNDKIEKRIQKNTFRVRVVNESDEIIGYDKESRNYRFRKAEDAIDFARDIMKTPDFESIAIDVHTDSGNTKFIFKAYKSDIEINVIEQEEFKRLHQQLKRKEIDGYQYIKEVAMLVSEYKIKVNGSFSDEDLENTTIDITGEYVEEPKQLPSARVEDEPSDQSQKESAESQRTDATESKEPEQKKSVHKYFPDSATAEAFFAETIGIQPKQPIKNQESTTDDTIKIVDAFDDSEEHEQELLKQLRAEMSKLSANPVFNPKIWTISLEIGGIYVQRGINSFATWAKQMTDSVGDEITPWLNSIWTTLKSYPAGQKFDQKQVTAMSQMLGSWREEGITSVDEIKSKFKDEFGEDLAKQFDSMIDASFKGISTFFTEQESTETPSEKTPEPAESQERTLVDELNDKQFAEDLMIKTQPITFDSKDLETGELEVVQQFADDIMTMDNFSSTQRYSKVKIRRDENDARGREYMFSDINKAVEFINAVNDKTKVNETKIDGIGGATIFQQTRGLKPQIDRSQGRVHVMEFQEVDRTPKKKLGQQNNSNQTERDSRISDKFNSFLKSLNPSFAKLAMREINLKPRRKIESLARDESNQFRFEGDKYYVGDERISRPEAAYFNYLRYTSGGEYLGKIAPQFFETLHFTHDENRKPTDEEIANGTYIETNEHLRPLFYRKLKVEKYPELKRWIERELKMPANGYEEALRVRRENRLQRIRSREISDEDLQAMEDAFKEDREVIVPSIEGSPETENATPNNSVTLPAEYRTESGRDINEADKDEFIVDKDGNRDFGEISKEIEKATNGSVTSDETEGNFSKTFSKFIKLFQNQNQAGTNQNRESLIQHLTPARQKRLELLATHKGLKFAASEIDGEKISTPEAIYFNYLRYINGDEYIAAQPTHPDLTVKMPAWLNTVLFQSDQGNNEFVRPLMERKLKGRPFLRKKLESLYNQKGSNYIFQRIWQADEELLGIYELGEKFKDKGGEITYSDENHAHGIITPTTYELAFPNGKKVTIKTEKKKNGLKQARKRVKSLLKKYLEHVSQKETESYLKEHNIHFKVEKIGSQDIGEISQDDNPQTKEIAGEKESSELDKIEQLNQMNLTDTPFSNDQISKNIASVVWNFKDKISPINSSDAKYRVEVSFVDQDKAWQKTKRPFLFQNFDDAYEFAKEIHKQTGISVAMFEQSPQGDKIQYINHGARLQFDPMAKKSNKKIKSDTLKSALFALDEMSAMFYKKAEQILKSRGEKIERSDIRFIRENRTYTAKEEAAKRGEMAIEPAQVKKILPKSFDVLRKRMDLGLALPHYSSREIATKIYDFENAFDEALTQDLQALEQNQTTDQPQAEMITDLVEKSAVNEEIQESSPEETVDEVKEHTDESSQDLDDAIKLRDNKLKGLNGKSLTIYSENNENEIEFNARYKIVDASELITSHEHLGGMYGINRNYPQALQPRDRMRVAMQDGISKMAGSLKPRKITASEDLNLGAPVVRSDGVVLNGNGRTLAIITAYSRKTADKYRDYLIEHAEDYGIDADQISNIDKPILIREITDNLDLEKTQEIIGAVLGGTQLGESEQAVNDAKKLRLKDLNGYVPVKNGNIAATQNATFLDNVANRIIPQDEYNKHTTSGGQWNAAAIRRVKQALIALAYPDNELVAKITESTEDDIKNISNALDYAKADVAHAVLMMKENHAYPYKLSETITRAVQRYDEIKRGDGDVQNFIRHNETALTDRESDEVLRMLEILEANKRKASKLGEILSSIARVIEAQGDPQLSDMFSGTVKRETLMEIINRVNSDSFFSSQTSLFDTTQKINAAVQKSPAARNIAEQLGATIKDGNVKFPSEEIQQKFHQILDSPYGINIAFHGSIHDFNEFAMDAVGNGEGNQAHGYGFYFATDKKIAERYRDETGLSHAIIDTGDKQYEQTDNSDWHELGSKIEVDDTMKIALDATFEQLIANNNAIDRTIADNPNNSKLKALLQRAKQWKFAQSDLNKKLYTVNLPDSKYLLDEQLPFEKQTQQVKMKLKQILTDKKLKGKTGKEIYAMIDSDPAVASNKLLNAGIQGITYMGKEDGRCFVIFDPKAINILKKYSMKRDKRAKIIDKQKILKQSQLTAREKAIQQMGSQLGVPVVFFDGDKKLHGYFTGGISFINRNSATSLDWTFWHESFHALQARDPNLYNKILSEIKKSQSFTDEQIQAYREEIGAFELSDDRIIEEMLADNMSQAARRSGILDSLRGNRNLFERFVDFIRDIYNRVKDYFNAPKNGLTKAQREAMNRSVARIAGSMKNLGIDSKPTRKMSEKKDVIEVTGKEFGEWSDIKDLRKKAIQYYRDNLQGRSVKNDLLGIIDFDHIDTVEFTGSGRDKVKDTSAQHNKLLLVPYLPRLIESAKLITSEESIKERHKREHFYKMKAYAIIDGKTTEVNITLIKHNDAGIAFYNHNAGEYTGNKKDEPVNSVAPESPQSEALGTLPVGSSLNESLSDADSEIKFSLDGHFNSASDTFAKNLGLKPTSNRINIVESKPIDDINLKQYYFGSPSRIKNQTFQFFFENARRGMQKLVQLRNNYARKFKVAMDLVSDDKARDNLYELLWRGDEEGVEYGKLTSAEKKGKTVDEIDQIRADRIVKETGVHRSAAIAYVKIRRLLEAVYRQLDARKRGVKNRTVYVKPENLSKALKSFEGNKFVTIMRIGEKNSEGKIPVAIREAQHWTDSAKNLTQAQLEQFQKDPVIQITRSKQNKDGTFNISYRRGKAGLTRLEGHLPHLFHHYTVRVKKKVGDDFVTTKDLEDKLKSYHAVIGSGKSQRDAIKVAEEWLKSHTLESDEQIFIEPHMFNFESLGQSESDYAPVVGDKDFHAMQKNIAKNHGMKLSEAKALVAGSVRSTSRHRFNGYFLQRHGSKGFEQDIQYVLRHYFNASARYIAMDEVKENAINKFERVFGAFDKDWNDHDLAQYVKNYIRDVNGNPSTLENTINNALNKSELWRNIFVPHFGDRAAISVTNSITSRLGYLTLGFLNMSSALLNFSQLINAAGYLGTLSDAGNLGKYFCKYFRGLKSGDGRISMRDLSILQKTGALNEIGLDSSSGYDQFRGHTSDFAILNALDWVGNKSMGLFQKTDALCRIATTLAAYDQAKSQGKSDAEAIKYAREINRKSNFDYSVADAPNIFRRGSIISQLALQFRKYGIKELEVMHDFLTSATSKKQKMMFWIPYFLAVGLMGVPAGDGLDWLFKDFFNIGSPKNFVQESIMEACGDSPEGRALGRALMYGIAGAAGVNISSRVGMQDVIPYRTSDFAGVAASKTYNLISDLFNEGFGLQAVRDVSPGAYNILAAAFGESRGARGRLNSTYDDFFERALRFIGFKSTDETISADIQRIIYDKRDKLSDDKKKAIDEYLDNPTAENARKLRKLEVKPSTVQEERKRKRMERLGRMKSLLSKKELKDNRQLLNFAR